MNTHDPKQMVTDIRDHLAVHDRTLVFLFGAGTSSAINIAPDPPPGQEKAHTPLIPTTATLTDLCADAVRELGVERGAAWGKLLSQCRQANPTASVEDVLSSVRMKVDAVGEEETLVGLTETQLREMESTICATIANAVNPDEETIPNRIAHDDFAAWVRMVNRTAPLEIFTTNYDVLLERAFEKAYVPVFDAFVGAHRPFFFAECVEDDKLLPPARWVRLWKLHGSVNWHSVDSDERKRIVRTDPGEVGEMILPSHRKYDESRKQPYIAYMDRLSRVLNADHTVLVTCGYSFRDDHVNAILYQALDSRSTVNIIALRKSDLSEDSALVRAACERSNLTVVGRNGGVRCGEWGHWQLSEAVDAKTASFMDIAFDSNGAPEGDGLPGSGSEDLLGQARLGDFNWFCRFLRAMGGSSR